MYPTQPRSGLYRAGEVLLLIGAILAVVGGVMLLIIGLLMGALFAEVEERGGFEGRDAMPSGMVAIMTWGYPIWGVLSMVGSIFAFLAYSKAKRGDARGGFVFGLIGSLVPPLNLLMLLGAIFCKVAPEGQAPPRAQAWQPASPGPSQAWPPQRP